MDLSNEAYPILLTEAKKNADGKQWFKDRANMYISTHYSRGVTVHAGNSRDNKYFNSRYRKHRVNYNIINNILDETDFNHVLKPYGDSVGKNPVRMTNRDILSNKLKVLHGLELSMPSSFRLMAVNPEASTRKEEARLDMIKQFVYSQIMGPIEQHIRLQKESELAGRELTPEEVKEVEDQIAQEMEAATPDVVGKYMRRDHQDPAEIQGNQILRYLTQKLKTKDKFQEGWKHATIVAEEYYFAGNINNVPVFRVVNPKDFSYGKIGNRPVQDCDWAVCRYKMSPAEALSTFGSALSKVDIERLFQADARATTTFNETAENIINHLILAEEHSEPLDRGMYWDVYHTVWKYPKRIGFLKKIDPNTGMIVEEPVDGTYKLRKDLGDISISWDYIPTVYETWKIGTDIFLLMQEVPGQDKDLDNLRYAPLPYKGINYDDLNSVPTSFVDRGITYQYLYNIILWNVEKLIGKDKNKKYILDVNSLAKTAGFTIEKTLYYLDVLDIAIVDTAGDEGKREGNRSGVKNFMDVLDASMVNDIASYIKLADYLDVKCGEAMGISKQMEASVGSTEAVTNVQHVLQQNTYLLKPYFDVHNSLRVTVLESLLEAFKISYASGNQPQYLSYTYDDMTVDTFAIDSELLDASTYGLFIGDATELHQAKKAVEQLSHAAMQSGRADLSDVIRVMKATDIQESEEILKEAEDRKDQSMQEMEQLKAKNAQDLLAQEQEAKQADHERAKELIILKAEEDRETQIQKQAIFSLGFDDNKDRDEDGIPDILEVAKAGVDADIKNRQLSLEENKFLHQKEMDNKTHDLKAKELRQKSPSREVKTKSAGPNR